MCVCARSVIMLAEDNTQQSVEIGTGHCRTVAGNVEIYCYVLCTFYALVCISSTHKMRFDQ
jgi:hypothetical protein